jgi:hypothetical protein
MKTFVFTSDSQMWALRPFEYLAKKYYPSADIEVVGFTPPPFPISYPFVSIGDQRNYPYSKWSNGIIDFLNRRIEQVFVMLLEDFWFTRMVDAEAIESLGEFMEKNPVVARVDLSTDRLYATDPTDVGPWGRIDLIQNPEGAPYTCSFQPGMWRKRELLRYLIPNETPHEAEMLGTNRMIDCHAIVLGTRQCPMRVLIAVQNGKLAIDNGYQVPKPYFSDKESVLHWIPKDRL